MRIGIFYISYAPGKNRQMIVCPSGVVYVRVEEVAAKDLSDALNEARPEPGESIMNTHRTSK